jgi:hypothetical protein
MVSQRAPIGVPIPSFVEQRELSARILLENKTSENIRKYLEMFKKNDKKFVIKIYSQHEIKNSNFEINKN